MAPVRLQLLCTLECRATTDEQLIPARAILVEQQHRCASSIDTGGGTRGLNFHQGDEPVHFGFLRHELGEDASEPQRSSQSAGRIQSSPAVAE